EGRGNVLEYVGGYDDWIRQGGKWTEPDMPADEAAAPKQPTVGSDTPKAEPKVVGRSKKLSYKLQREFDELPQRIEQLEQQQAELQTEVSTPELFAQAPESVEAKMQELARIGAELEQCMERWAEHEDLQQAT